MQKTENKDRIGWGIQPTLILMFMFGLGLGLGLYLWIGWGLC